MRRKYWYHIITGPKEATMFELLKTGSPVQAENPDEAKAIFLRDNPEYNRTRVSTMFIDKEERDKLGLR